MDGLIVKNGRLINLRPDGISGSEEASMYRRQMKASKAVKDIADGIELAEMRSKMRNDLLS